MTQQLFDECIKQAIKLGRKYMDEYDYSSPEIPTKEEWQLALVIFQSKLAQLNYFRGENLPGWGGPNK